MKSTTTTALVAAGALLVGGIATAAFMKGGSSSPDAVTAAQTRPTLDTTPLADDGARTDQLHFDAALADGADQPRPWPQLRLSHREAGQDRSH